MITFLNLGKRSLFLNFKTVEVKKNEIGKFDATVVFDNEEEVESLVFSMDYEDLMALGESLTNAAYAVKTKAKYEMKWRL